MTTYAARHVALGGDDSEPEGLASHWGDGPPPRRAMMAEESATSYEPYVPEPELLPFSVVEQQDPVLQQAVPSELGLPVVAPPPSQTMGWHIAVEPSAPLAPGPVHAATPVTVEGPMTDPASYPTPVSHFAAVSYQSMPSPSPYASAPAQGPYVAPMASPYTAPMPEPYSAGDATLENVVAVGAKAMAAAGLFQRVFGLVIVGIVLAGFTAAGVVIGGTAWWTVAFAWAMGIFMLTRIVRPGRV